MPDHPETTATHNVATPAHADKPGQDPDAIAATGGEPWDYDGAEDVDVPIPFRLTVSP